MHTGVKSAGCEKRIAHEPSSHLWKSMSPCVVFAEKFGACDPRRRRGCSVGVAYERFANGDPVSFECAADRTDVRDVTASPRRVVLEVRDAIMIVAWVDEQRKRSLSL